MVTASSPDSRVTMSPRQVPLMPGKKCLLKGRGLAGGGAGARGGNCDPRMQMPSSGPQAREQTLGQDGHPQHLHVAMHPTGSVSLVLLLLSRSCGF